MKKSNLGDGVDGYQAKHTATIPVVENLPPRMYLREELATGKADNGTPIEIATTGTSIIIQLGEFQPDNSSC